MSAPKDLQQTLFEQIEQKLPEHVALVDEVAAQLDISRDSSYRRIRGEKLLNFPELQTLCREHQVSADALFQLDQNSVLFDYYPLEEENFDFTDYFENILRDLEWLQTFDEKEVIYATNDMPLFQILQVPEVAAFKLFFWMKTTMGFSDFQDQPFSFDALEATIEDYRKDILEKFVRIPSIDILGEETINSFIKQIDFYYASGFFESREDAVYLCDRIIDLLNHLQKQAELGSKFVFGKEPAERPDNYQLYYNEVVSTDNAILVKTGDHYTTYITNNAVNYMKTGSSYFYQNTKSYLEHLMSKSSLISSVSEKERNQFFIGLKEKVERLRKKLKAVQTDV